MSQSMLPALRTTTWYLVFSPEMGPPVPLGAKADEYFYHLDLLARLNKLPELLSYIDLRPMPGGVQNNLQTLLTRGTLTEEDVRRNEAERIRQIGEWRDWFDAAEGLAVFEKLSKVLARDGFKQSIQVEKSLRGFLKTVPPELLKDLERIAEALRQAVEAGARFRIESRWNAGHEAQERAAR